MILHELIAYDVLRLIWWALLGVLLAGFALTDGFDLGTGTLLPFVARSDVERRVVINTIGPVWEGNQVWLILGGGAIFAAWPQLYAVSFSGFYLAMFAILVALILRPVAFKFRSKREQPGWRSAWDWALFTGGFVPALIFGVAMGNVLQGVPFRIEDDSRIFYEGSFFGLLNPYALLCGLVSVAMLVTHGAAWLQLKTSAAVAEQARRFGIGSALATVLLYAVAGLLLASFVTGYAITSSVDPTGASNPLLKSAVARQGAWFANYGAQPALWIAPAAGLAGPVSGALPGRPSAPGRAAGQRYRHHRDHHQRRRVDVPLHPALIPRAFGKPDGLGLILESSDPVHHARLDDPLHAHHPGLHQLGVLGPARQGRGRIDRGRQGACVLTGARAPSFTGIRSCGTSPGFSGCPWQPPSRCSMHCGSS